MDSLSYNYNASTNWLNHVNDGASASNYTTDIDDQLAGNFLYDPLGNRASKGLGKYSDRNEHVWYVRDAQGNVMAVYNMKYNWDHSFGPFRLIEHHMYGSSRLGIIQRDQDMDSAKANATNESLLGYTYIYSPCEVKSCMS